MLYLPFAAFVLVGSTNMVNLTDGLDGLAISVFAVVGGGVHGAGVRLDPRRVRELPAADPPAARRRRS